MFSFSLKIVFDFGGLFLVPILVRNLYTGDPYEGLPPNAKYPGYGPVGNHRNPKPKKTRITFDTMLTL